MYIHRHAESTIQTLANMFGAVLVAGPRQVGKTTMLKSLTSGINYVTLDDPLTFETSSSPLTFLKDNPPPVFIDEIQKQPQLFNTIKLSLDQTGLKGQFYLCGSQQFQMMEGVSESLSGRIGILNLPGISLREEYGIPFDSPFIPTPSYLDARRATTLPLPYDDLWKAIHRGSMPQLVAEPTFNWELFYGSYTSTYIERDVKSLSQIGDTLKFTRFMTAAASMTGKLLNLSSLANSTGISQPLAEKWLSVLVASNIVYLLHPYSNNSLKRAVKTPKLYFFDTGLAAYLTRWTTPDVLKSGAMSGPFFETFVISEILKSYYNRGISEPPLYYYRDKDMNEIDLLIEDGGTLYPIEIKSRADVSPADIKSFGVLDKLPQVTRAPGGIICPYDSLRTLPTGDMVIPVNYL